MRTMGDRTVSSIGVGGAILSLVNPDEDRAVRVLCAALDAGITLLDTAGVYVPSPDARDVGHNERLMARAIAEWGGPSDAVTVVTKGGHRRIGRGLTSGDFENCGRAEYIHAQCAESLEALGTEAIDVYLLHWPDPNVPIEESMAALVALQDKGMVRHAGLSNVSVEQLRAALTVGPVAAVQNPFSPYRRDSEPVLRICEELGIAFMAYSPLGGGAKAKTGDLPGFQRIADARGVSVQQIVLAWELSLSPAMIPVIGPSRVESVRDSAGAMALQLSDTELKELAA